MTYQAKLELKKPKMYPNSIQFWMEIKIEIVTTVTCKKLKPQTKQSTALIAIF